MDPLRRITAAEKFVPARQLRRTPTPAERYVWSLLRHRGVLGLKFRRQHVVHGFIVDFFCAAERLVVEPEGDAHDGIDQPAYDASRAELLRAAGYLVVRVRNRDVTRPRLERLLAKALRGPSQRSPSPEGRGGQGVRTHGRSDSNSPSKGEATGGEDPRVGRTVILPGRERGQG